MKRTVFIFAAIGFLLFAPFVQAQWEPARRLTWTGGDSGWPAIEVDYSGHLYVVWHDSTPGNLEIYFKKSTDGGDNWTPNHRRTWNSETSWYADIAVDTSSNIYVVWSDSRPGQEDVFFKKSTDGGATWTADRRLTWNSGRSRNPMIALDSYGYLHVVWFDETPGNYEIYYKSSLDGGTSWTSAQRLTFNPGASNRPVLVADSFSDLHVFWFDETPGNYEIFHKKSTNGGADWTDNQRLTWNSDASLVADCAVDSLNNLHLVWFDWTPGLPEVFYKKSTNGGKNWTANRRLTWNAGNSGAVRVAVDSANNPHVVWQDDTPGNYEIYYKKSLDGGWTWTASRRLTWISEDSEMPVLGIDVAGNIHVVWEDGCFGNTEIFYKKGK